MYEDITYEEILNRMLNRVPDTIDKREGSIIYDALAPAAIEMKMMYDQMDVVYNETFADTATREYLVKRVAERGIVPYAATYALLEGKYTPEDLSLPIGSRFSGGGLTYTVEALLSGGTCQIRCEVEGAEGNKYFGSVIPIDYIDGLETITITRLLIPGDDEEDTEHLRQRYFNSLNTQAFGGNKTDYREKVTALTGVGAVKVYRAANGPGTVRLVIMTSEYGTPSDVLIEQVQNQIDPEYNQGDGEGIAPIGHLVCVEGVQMSAIDIDTTVTLDAGWSFEDIVPYLREAVDEYFLDLAKEWAGEQYLTVRVSQLESRFLNIAHVVDVGNTLINGVAENRALGEDEIPERRRINGQATN